MPANSALFLQYSSLFHYLSLFSLIIASNFCFCFCFHPKRLNVSRLQSDADWAPTRASWYGHPRGAGSDAGACGYQNAVETVPFSSLVTAVASSLYDSGKACGTCYEVKCTRTPFCSGDPVRVVVTDVCPDCDSRPLLFDLSGTAFGAMASNGNDDLLRNVGIVDIQYRGVDCNFNGTSVAFRVDQGSNPYYFATSIEYENGDGLTGAELQGAGDSSGTWLQMQQLWGAVWKVDFPNNYPGPFSIRLTGGGSDSGKTIVADSVIPANYIPGMTYRSIVNFEAAIALY